MLQLMRPVREVAIAAGVMLPGDASPAALNAVLQLEEEEVNNRMEEVMFQLFSSDEADPRLDDNMLFQLSPTAFKGQKQSQQRGRKVE